MLYENNTEIIFSIALLYVEQRPNIESYESGVVFAAGYSAFMNSLTSGWSSQTYLK